MAKKEVKKSPEDIKFEADGEIYAFAYPKVEVNVKGKYEKLTAEQCAERPEVLAHLVSIGSGAIKNIGKASDEKPATVPQLKSILDAAGIEYDPKAVKADLEALVAELDKEGDLDAE